jgi:hypothetical protein
MRQLVFLIVAIFQVDEDTQVMCSGSDSDARSGKFGAELIEATSSYALLRTVYEKRRDRRMM